jgi:hypothetical protein
MHPKSYTSHEQHDISTQTHIPHMHKISTRDPMIFSKFNPKPKPKIRYRTYQNFTDRKQQKVLNTPTNKLPKGMWKTNQQTAKGI